MMRRLISIAALGVGLHCLPAAAALSCEQLSSVAYAAQQMRDRGLSLAAVVAEADKPELIRAFSPGEIERIKDVIEQAYLSARSPKEVLLACKSKQR